MKYCIGIDVGGTTVKMGIFEAEGRLIRKWEIPTRKGEGGKQFIGDAAESIRKALSELQISMEDVLGAGMGVPGPVVANGYVDVCVNLGLHKCYPGDDLSKALGGVKVCLGNDANVAALGEMWQGAGKGHNSICMVTLGTGVGGGLVNEGRMISGVHGLAGEIGHMHVQDEEPEVCNCGGHGCLEQYASATGIVRVAKRNLARTRRASAMRDFGEALSAKDVWCYTGYTLETDLQEGGAAFTPFTKDMLARIDVLVDGEFVEALKDIKLRFRGSSNQRIIDLKRTRESGGIKLWLDGGLDGTYYTDKDLAKGKTQ